MIRISHAPLSQIHISQTPGYISMAASTLLLSTWQLMHLTPILFVYQLPIIIALVPKRRGQGDSGRLISAELGLVERIYWIRSMLLLVPTLSTLPRGAAEPECRPDYDENYDTDDNAG